MSTPFPQIFNVNNTLPINYTIRLKCKSKGRIDRPFLLCVVILFSMLVC